MNALIGLAIALAVSLAGNLWLFNSRDAALTKNGQITTALAQTRDLAKTCSDSVQKLKDQADAAEAIAELEREKVRKLAEDKTINGTRTLQLQPSTPGNDCKSTSDLLRSWHSQRVLR